MQYLLELFRKENILQKNTDILLEKMNMYFIQKNKGFS